MKKHLTTFLSFALTMFMAFTLTNCGSEVEIDNNSITVKPGQTVFSTSNGAETRTSMDADRYFYWESGDKIWVNSTGNTYLPSISSTIGTQTKVPSCDFVFDASLTEETYPVLYTGQNSPEASQTTANSLHVTIKNNQTQAAWNDGSHLGSSGDCGTATAKRRGSGSYEFQLLHRASYLVIYPYTVGATGCTLTKVEIESDNAIAGTYSFSADGLNTSSITNPSNTITLTPGSTFSLGNTSGNHLFVVIQPGTHSLSVKCTFKNASNDEFTNTKLLQAGRTFNPNGVTTVNFPLSESAANIDPEFNFTLENALYLWDAKTWIGYDYTNYPTQDSQEAFIQYSISNTSWCNLINGEDRASNSLASNSAKGMPCANALSWYLTDSIYYDTTTEWTLDGKTYNKGWWMRKWEYITGKPQGATILNCPEPSSIVNGAGIVNVGRTAGKPGPGYIDTFFFLPHLGRLNYAGSTASGASLTYYSRYGTGFWSSSPVGNNGAYYLDVENQSTGRIQIIRSNDRIIGSKVAGTRPDGSPWFQ